MLSSCNSSPSSTIGADESVMNGIEDKLFVALGADVKEGKWILTWALQNSGGKKICLLHVLVPAQMISMMGGKFPANSIKPAELRAFRELERQKMHKTFNEYTLICKQAGVTVEKLHIEMVSIEKGIVELIAQNGIKRLVMGAAAKKYYSKKMMGLRSKKAIYVYSESLISCHILFVCKGSLIFTREAKLEKVDNEILPQTKESTIKNQENGQKYPPVSLWQNTVENLLSPKRHLLRSEYLFTESVTTSSSSFCWDMESSSSHAPSSRVSMGSSSDVQSTADMHVLSDEKDIFLQFPPSILKGRADSEFYQQPEQAMEEVRNSKQAAFEESLQRVKAEKDAMEAIHRAKVAEDNYAEELKQRQDIELLLMREREELEKMHNQRDEVINDLQTALNQKSNMEAQLAESNEMINALEKKVFSAIELIKNYKNECEALLVERENAVKSIVELKRPEKSVLVVTTQFVSEFTVVEIEEATQNFHPSLKIWEGEYGSIYRGLLHHTEVAVKMMHCYSLQGPLEYQQEVDVMSKLRHPNLITLIGTCPEIYSLIYEYLPNGSLEDRLNCKDNTPPLPWQYRIRIVTELCSVLVYLHSSKPHGIVHGDLKPSNILLDSNFVSKLTDFGIYRKNSDQKTVTVSYKTGPKGTLAYTDPEFLVTGKLTTKSDVYSFGIIILQLLTGKSAFGIFKEVKKAIDNGTLRDVLDSSAGNWPDDLAQQLADVGLRCALMARKIRPNLEPEVCSVLDPMRATYRRSSASLQEMMQESDVALDGFT